MGLKMQKHTFSRQLRNSPTETSTCLIRVGRVLSLVCLLVRYISMYKSIDDMVYIANVGDSRAFMSGDGGNYNIELSRDHKPNDDLE
jgi:serine/threonine protein phosphatase PrpC